jgi:hypothetical protein
MMSGCLCPESGWQSGKNATAVHPGKSTMPARTKLCLDEQEQQLYYKMF